MIFFALWRTFDDHLATALDVEALGSLPVWVPLLMGLALTGRLTVRPQISAY